MRWITLAFLVSGCAAIPIEHTEPGGSEVVSEPVPPPTGLLQPPSTPPLPVPPPPPDSASFLTGEDPVLASTGDPRVDAYRWRILQEAGNGWLPYLLRLFHGVAANPQIPAAHAATEEPDSPGEWVRRYVTPQMIAAGRRFYAQFQRDPPPSPAGVPLEVQLALWGIYSNYGEYPPSYDVMQAYLMLGAYDLDPPGPTFDIYTVADLIVRGEIDRAKGKSYEDGRLGQVQLLPDEWRILARDGDGDGKVDIWGKRADIFASIGPIEWEEAAPMIVEVGRLQLDPDDPREGRMLRAVRSGSVGAYMFPRPGGGAWSPESHTWSGRYVEPFGVGGPAYLLTRNFTPINYRNPSKPRYWNESEDPGFGMAVALLADAIAGRPGPTVPIR